MQILHDTIASRLDFLSLLSRKKQQTVFVRCSVRWNIGTKRFGFWLRSALALNSLFVWRELQLRLFQALHGNRARSALSRGADVRVKKDYYVLKSSSILSSLELRKFFNRHVVCCFVPCLLMSFQIKVRYWLKANWVQHSKHSAIRYFQWFVPLMVFGAKSSLAVFVLRLSSVDSLVTPFFSLFINRFTFRYELRSFHSTLKGGFVVRKARPKPSQAKPDVRQRCHPEFSL